MKQIIFLLIILSFLPCFIKSEELLVTGSSNVSIASRIIGGEEVSITFFPYMASFRVNDSVVWPYFSVTMHTGTSSSQQIGNMYFVKRINVHPGWTGTEASSHNHDIAHIKLLSKITFNHYQLMVNRPVQNVISNEWGYVSGWGTTDPNVADASSKLRYVSMWSLNYTDCQPFMIPGFVINKEQMCAYQMIGQGCCSGDSGAPFFVNGVIVGIHSWIRMGAPAAGEPEIFTDVYAQRDFITVAIQSN